MQTLDAVQKGTDHKPPILRFLAAAQAYSVKKPPCGMWQVESGVLSVKKDYYRALRNFVALLPAQIPVDLEFLLP